MSRPIRVLLVDDQRLMRDGLHTLLELEPDIEVAGEAEDGRQALGAYARLSPNVVLMDIRMPNLDGVEATRRLCRDDPSARVLILTTFDDDAYVLEGLRAGALGYLLKDASGRELAAAVRAVAAGNVLIGPGVAHKVLSELARTPPAGPAAEGPPAAGLTERELEVLRLLAAGRNNAEIAGRLFLAEGTVKNYVTSILHKLGVRDRTQAALRGRELGLL
ncbi:MAG: response regulator [Candidatus Promineifilaceae bacterium]